MYESSTDKIIGPRMNKHGFGTHISYLTTGLAGPLSPHLENKMIQNYELEGEAGCWVSILGPRVSGHRTGRRTQKTFDLVSIFHNAPCCPWYLNEHDSTDLLSVGLALCAAFQWWGWIYADSLTLAFSDAFSFQFLL